MRENKDQESSESGYFSRRECFAYSKLTGALANNYMLKVIIKTLEHYTGCAQSHENDVSFVCMPDTILMLTLNRYLPPWKVLDLWIFVLTLLSLTCLTTSWKNFYMFKVSHKKTK